MLTRPLPMGCIKELDIKVAKYKVFIDYRVSGSPHGRHGGDDLLGPAGIAHIEVLDCSILAGGGQAGLSFVAPIDAVHSI